MTTTTTPRGELTAQQAAVLRFVAAYFAANMRPPTVREIGEHMGIGSPNGVVCHLTALRRKGWLEPPSPFSSRGLVIVGLADAVRAAVEDHLRGLLAGE